ncbi:LOW QUALITY PROTEIN: piggyBac transposable element-derived protein 3-like [Macrobrachium rosenbergii]|uniref:LOW QUALITY PROTEIN: piggyBac transposable element-derived protein 3-like n=1 Tax=Macrobrachium rosenbergii TaxID=79674 RepID=UPI0034D75564
MLFGCYIQPIKLPNTCTIRSDMFYGRRNAALEHEEVRTAWIAPEDAEDSDVDVEVDSDCEDPTYQPDEDELADAEFLQPTTSRGGRPVPVAVPHPMPDVVDSAADVPSASSRNKKARPHQWKKEDISNQPLPDYVHERPCYLRAPMEYFLQFFTNELAEHIVYQTNLYSRQKDVGGNFNITEAELKVFMGAITFMGLVPLPSIVDYWAVHTRIPQIANCMSRNRFKAIRSNLHFSDNDLAAGSRDRFLKVRAIFSKVTREFLKVAETPVQSIDEVMVTYKGTTAGNLRQYVAKKPDKWGYIFFCRSSVDGFVHDILMYQGESTFSSHHTTLSEEEEKMPVTSKFVVALVKTLKNPKTTAVYADNYFTSLSLAEYLRSQYQCRYVGTARENRVGFPPLMTVKDMSKKTVARGTLDFVSSEGILAARWKDNNIVTVLSTDVGVEPVADIQQYNREEKKKVGVPCPNVITKYNSRMGGIDKSDMLTHLYKTPFKAKRYYMRLFAYIVDLIICNAWLLYKRDCLALQSNPMPLKDFRLSIALALRAYKVNPTRVTRVSLTQRDVPSPKRGQRAVVPAVAERQDATKLHMPLYVKARQTCKFCSCKGHIHRSQWVCEDCKVALCLTDARNCFALFHKA